MVLEKIYRRRIVDRLVSHQPFIKDRGHRGDILMAEPNIGANKTSITRFDGFYAYLVIRQVGDKVPGEHLLGKRHRTPRSVNRGNRNLALQPRDIEREQPAVLYDLTRYLVFTVSEFF